MEKQFYRDAFGFWINTFQFNPTMISFYILWYSVFNTCNVGSWATFLHNWRKKIRWNMNNISIVHSAKRRISVMGQIQNGKRNFKKSSTLNPECMIWPNANMEIFVKYQKGKISIEWNHYRIFWYIYYNVWP